MNTKNKLVTTLVLAAVGFAGSTFAMQDTAMGDKMMKDDKMMATGTMMKDKMEDKMKMLMAITNKSARSEVAKLQQHLIDEGYLKVPKWVKLGYYGPLTKAAYAKYSEKMKMMSGESMMKDDKMMVK